MKELLDMNRIPQHIAIIMDGNGRWATAGLPSEGLIVRLDTRPVSTL